MSRFPFLGIVFALIFSLSGCGSRVSPPLAAASLGLSPSDYRISFTNGHEVTFQKAYLSFKNDRAGQTWLSVRAPNLDMQYTRSIIRGVWHVTADGTTAIDLTSVPMRSTFEVQPPNIGAIKPLCTVTPLSVGIHPMCSGGSDCEILDGNCVNSNGDCVMSAPCGAYSSTDGDGTGTGYIGFHDGFACEIDFTSDYLDCFDNASGPTYTDADLFLGSRLTNLEWWVTCNNPQSAGWAIAHYLDKFSNGNARHGNIGAAPGTNQWYYPGDFPGINGQYPPGPPVDFSSRYFAFGALLHLFSSAEGHCNDILD